MQNELEQKLIDMARDLPFPPTPDVTGRVSHLLGEKRQVGTSFFRPVAVGLASLLALLAVALIVPQSRASLLTFLRVGAVDIELTEAVTIPQFLEDYPALALQETTLSIAREQSELPLLQPAGYPDPDMVFWQTLADTESAGAVTIFVWLDVSGQAELSLFQINSPHYGLKRASVEAVIRTEVGPYAAFWLPGPHVIYFTDSTNSQWQLVEGNVLVWTDDTRTFRIESGMSLAATVAIAESLR